MIRVVVYSGTGTPSGILSPLGFGDGGENIPVSFHGDGDGEKIPPRVRG